MTVGEKIKETRIIRGITQKELGEKIGYSAMAISHFEKGSRKLPLIVIQRIEQILGGLSNKKALNRRVGKSLNINK